MSASSVDNLFTMSAPIHLPRFDPSAFPWRATRHTGVSWCPFAVPSSTEDDPEDAVVLIRMDPGCSYPPHRHGGVEDVLVLQGGYRDDRGDHLAGSFFRYPSGSTHAPVALGDRSRPVGEDNPSCILFAIARGGVHDVENA